MHLQQTKKFYVEKPARALVQCNLGAFPCTMLRFFGGINAGAGRMKPRPLFAQKLPWTLSEAAPMLERALGL